MNWLIENWSIIWLYTDNDYIRIGYGSPIWTSSVSRLDDAT